MRIDKGNVEQLRQDLSNGGPIAPNEIVFAAAAILGAAKVLDAVTVRAAEDAGQRWTTLALITSALAVIEGVRPQSDWNKEPWYGPRDTEAETLPPINATLRPLSAVAALRISHNYTYESPGSTALIAVPSWEVTWISGEQTTLGRSVSDEQRVDAFIDSLRARLMGTWRRS